MRVLIILTLLITFIILGSFYLRYNKQAPKIDNLPSLQSSSPFKSKIDSDYLSKTFDSKTMKFTIQIPSKYTIQDNSLSVDLVLDNLKINITRNGTNFSNLSDYIKDFNSKRRFDLKVSKKESINGYDSLSRLIILPDNTNQKSYYIYVDHWVYSLSTSSEALYSDLDQIAKSFKYNP